MNDVNEKKDIETLLAGRYCFEKFMDDDGIYRVICGEEKPCSDTVIASLTAGCLRIDAVFYGGGHDCMPVFEVYVKASPDVNDWVCFDSPDEGLPVPGADLLRYMFETLEKVRMDYGLSYDDPGFETLEGKKVKASDKPLENGGIGMV